MAWCLPRAAPAAAVEEAIGAYTTIAGFARLHGDEQNLRTDALGHSFQLVRRGDGLYWLDYSLLGLIRLDLGALGEVGFSRRRVSGRELLIARSGKQELTVGARIERPA